MGSHVVVAAVERLLIVNPVPFDLAVDRRPMPLQAFSHHTDRDLGRVHTGDLAPFSQAQVDVGQGHSASECKPFVCNGIRTPD
jgi:hypothetical protein